MTGVQGIPFTPSSVLPLSANQERGGRAFFWPDAGSADFFDQYVELGESDRESSSARGGDGLGQSCGGTEDLSDSPQLSFKQLLPRSDGGQQMDAHGEGHLQARGALNNGSVAGQNSHRGNMNKASQQPLHPSSSMAGFDNPDMEGLSGGGSISDSELLKLEGLTMRSPRIHIPQLPASEHASPEQAISPRKAGRLEACCNKVRSNEATLHGKAKQPEHKTKPEDASLSMPVMSTATMEPATTTARPRPQNLSISKSQLPSPPLTNGMPNQARPVTDSDAALVNGFLDDPFMPDNLLNNHFVPPLQLNGNAMPQTPLTTPSPGPMWQMPVSTPNTKSLWTNPTTYFSEPINDAATTWWDPTDTMDTDPFPPSYHASATTNASNASLNLSIQLQHCTAPSFDYPAPPGIENPVATFTTTSNLMLDMPQPRADIPSVVLHGTDAATITTAHHPSHADHHQHRSPRPRARSTGARRHHAYGGPGASPRKAARAAGGSARRSTSATRLGSVSPSPKVSSSPLPLSDSGAGAGRLHRRSASVQPLNQPLPGSSALSSCAAATLAADGGTAVRKRPSWTSGRRTTTTSGSSGSLRAQYLGLAVAAATATGSSSPSSSSPSRRRRTNTVGEPSTARLVSMSFPRAANTNHHTHSPSLVPGHLTTTYSHSFPHSASRTTAPSPCIAAKTLCSRSPKRTTTTAAAAAEAKSASGDGFVNYTPQDRALLMTGVAPSGSSKTKARREREAAERRRDSSWTSWVWM
ncbi:hypothetical protein VTI74DRAFT_1200 [Chaetomium olivicolor]